MLSSEYKNKQSQQLDRLILSCISPLDHRGYLLLFHLSTGSRKRLSIQLPGSILFREAQYLFFQLSNSNSVQLHHLMPATMFWSPVRLSPLSIGYHGSCRNRCARRPVSQCPYLHCLCNDAASIGSV
jgi:hypothetical protein